MVNVRELEEFIPTLYFLEQHNRFNMEMWADGVVNPQAASIHECGTQFCAAGAKARIDGWLPQYKRMQRWNTERREMELVLEATGQFVLNPNQQDSYEYEGVEAEVIAAEAFDLTGEQVQFLFYATHITRASDMERRMRWLIDGKSPCDFPEEWEKEEHRHSEQDKAEQESAEF